MESGGSRNYFRAAIRRTEIHSVVKQSLPLSAEGFEGREENEGGNEGGHTRERTLSRHAVSGVIDPVLRYPTSVLRTHVGRQNLFYLSLGNEEIGFRFYSRNLKPPLLRLSLNAVQFSVSYPLRRIRQSDTLLHSFRVRSYLFF